jgi:hypothetical protein
MGEQNVNAFLIVAAAIPTKISSPSSAGNDQRIFAGRQPRCAGVCRKTRAEKSEA